MKIDQITQLRAVVGFTAGMTVGMIGAGIVIVFFTPMSAWLKIFTAIGLMCAVGMNLIQLLVAVDNLNNFNKAMEMMKKVGDDSKGVVKNYVG